MGGSSPPAKILKSNEQSQKYVKTGIKKFGRDIRRMKDLDIMLPLHTSVLQADTQSTHGIIHFLVTNFAPLLNCSQAYKEHYYVHFFQLYVQQQLRNSTALGKTP